MCWGICIVGHNFPPSSVFLDLDKSTPNTGYLTKLGVIMKVSPEWRTIGLQFGIHYSVLDNYASKELNDNIACCTQVFDAWIKCGGTGEYPASWEGLYKLLCDIEHRGTANEMKDDLAKDKITF